MSIHQNDFNEILLGLVGFLNYTLETTVEFLLNSFQIRSNGTKLLTFT